MTEVYLPINRNDNLCANNLRLIKAAVLPLRYHHPASSIILLNFEPNLI